MSYQLSQQTKELLSKRIGIPYEQLLEMSDEEIDEYIEKKTGKKIQWPKGAKVDEPPIKELEDHSDRDIHEALVKGMKKYFATADQRSAESKHDRGVAFARLRSDLKKFDTLHRKALEGKPEGREPGE